MKHFIPSHILECGQVFRYEKLDEEDYLVTANDERIRFRKDGDDVLFYTSKEDFHRFWYDYFDLGTCYSQIRKDLEEDFFTGEHADIPACGRGIRILRQPLEDAIFGFLLSANSNIPKIRFSLERMCQEYGEEREDAYGSYYTFPDLNRLKEVSPQEIRAKCSVGFRDVRILSMAKLLTEQPDLLSYWSSLPDEQLKKELLKLPGIGTKVADCILLYGFHRMEAFPVDVWIHRIMQALFFPDKVSKKQVENYAKKAIKRHRGMAQQYLFWYARAKNS